MKSGTGVKLDVFYTMVTKKFVKSLLLRHYDVITCMIWNDNFRKSRVPPDKLVAMVTLDNLSNQK